MAEQNQSGANTQNIAPESNCIENNNSSIVLAPQQNKQLASTATTENNGNNNNHTKSIQPLPQAKLASYRNTISFNPPKLRTVDEYEKHHKIGQGTYGRVYKARDKRTDRLVALKQIRIKENEDGLSITTIREIKILKSLSHINVINLIEIVLETPIDKNKDIEFIYMVFEYMEHDLSGLAQCEGKSIQNGQIRCYIKQLLEGLSYCHRNKIIHRDIKGANMLINNQGILKLADFGLARKEKDKDPHYTNKVVTLWYRAPELLLGATKYGPSIDMWSVGCILVELYKGAPAFPAASESEQLDRIFSVCGTPDEINWPGVNLLPNYKNCKPNVTHPRQLDKFLGSSVGPEALSLIEELLTLDPSKRITAENALLHKYFFATNGKYDEPPKPEDLPRYTSSYHELDAQKLRKNNALKRQKDIAGNSLAVNHNYNSRPYGGPGIHVPRGAHAPFGQRNPEYKIPPRGNNFRGGNYQNRGAPGGNRGAPNSRGGPPMPSSTRGNQGYPPPANYARPPPRYEGGANGSRENINNNAHKDNLPPSALTGEKRRRDE